MVELALCCLGEQGFQVVTERQKLKLIVHLTMSWMCRVVTSKQCRPVLCASVFCILVVVYLHFVRNPSHRILIQSANSFLPETLNYSHHNYTDEVLVTPARGTTSDPFLSGKG